jgi:acyl-CoA synthetase (AMP-forming)/AMP-acid ligase II
MSDMTIQRLLARGADAAVAISTPEGRYLSYGELRRQTHTMQVSLAGLGLTPADRVALVLDNGAEMATCFLAVASACTAAPLNPAYRAEEFDFYLHDLGAKLLIVDAGKDSPCRAVAQARNIPIVELVPDGGGGRIRLAGAEQRGDPQFSGELDIALVLHTSGTTSRPKIVPLSHKNVVTSATNIRLSLALGEADRGLNVMPLFHIHGLIAGLLAPLSAGGEVCCTPGFNALQFFRWLRDAKPTWYTAVPTMHQTILARAAKNADAIAASPLRFIRSSSSALPVQVIGELEAVFNAPVLEAYGMTEAAHQMAANPLPPERRKPGTVGRAAGPELAVMDDGGQLLPPGSIGEVVIRGANVTAGYENNPSANAAAYRNGWFRTGDQGVLDDEGYLSITGRLKEIINRGGEKVSPREVDEILMDHPAVAQVVTFAVPHAMLGEEVAAAVVIRDGASADARELREFAAARLAAFKVPRQIVFLDEIPKGATGKLQRIGLAQKLGLS